MNTKIYEYLLAAAEEKNITRAAEKCFISQPALSQHIKKAEGVIGGPLFVKQGKELQPTKGGEIFLTTARRMLQVEKEMITQIEEYKAAAPISYRVFIDTHMRNLFIQSIWPKFLEHYPDVKLSLLSGDTDTGLEYLESQLVDVGIFPVCGLLPSSIRDISIDQNEYLLILPENHFLTTQFSRTGIEFRLLKDETFIMNQNFSLFSTMQEEILERHGLAPGKKIFSHSLQRIAHMVSRGQGISLLPDIILPLANQGITALSLNPPWHFRHVVAYHNAKGLDSFNVLLGDLLIHHYQQFKA